MNASLAETETETQFEFETDLEIPSLQTRIYRVTLAVFFCLASLMPILISVNRHLGADEVEHFYASFTVATGGLLYTDIWQGHHPLFYYVYSLFVFENDPVLSYRLARGFSTLLMLGQIGLTYFCANRLIAPTAAVIASGALLLQTTFCNRGIEIRPDVPAAFCVLLAFAIYVSGSRDLRRLCLQALVLSIGFLFSKKIAIACLVFGCLWAVLAIQRKSLKWALVPVVVWCIPTSLFALHLFFQGNLSDYLQLNFFDVASMTSRNAAHIVGAPTATELLFRESLRNPFFAVTLVIGVGYGLASWRSKPQLTFAAGLCSVLMAGLFLNPFPWAYNHLFFLPVGSVLIGAALAALAARFDLTASPIRRLVFCMICFALAGLQSLPFILEKATASPIYQNQLDVLSEVNRTTSPDDAVFDRFGLYFRPAGHWQYIMNEFQLIRFDRAEAPYAEIEGMLSEREVVAVVLNYRTRDLLLRRKPFAEFVSEHFVYAGGNLLVQGTAILDMAEGQSRSFVALKEKQMAFSGKGALLVDGEAFTEGVISRGHHVLTSAAPVTSGRLMLATAASQDEQPHGPVQLYLFGE